MLHSRLLATCAKLPVAPNLSRCDMEPSGSLADLNAGLTGALDLLATAKCKVKFGPDQRWLTGGRHLSTATIVAAAVLATVFLSAGVMLLFRNAARARRRDEQRGIYRRRGPGGGGGVGGGFFMSVLTVLTVSTSFSSFSSSSSSSSMVADALLAGGVEVPHARPSSVSRVLDGREAGLGWPVEWPYAARDLTPEDASDDGLFYLFPKFVHHAGEECRQGLTDYYACVLPTSSSASMSSSTKPPAVLDLCSSWTSHYPKEWNGNGNGEKVKCVALGLNALELAFNPSKTEWRVQNLNKQPALPFEDNEVGSFIILSLATFVDSSTSFPLSSFFFLFRCISSSTSLPIPCRWTTSRALGRSFGRCCGC